MRPRVVVALSPKESLRLPTGQAGGVRRKKRVVIAMSGGIDSSVAAALLKRAGVDELRSSSRTSSLGRVRKNFNSFGFAKARAFDVIGVFMKFWSEPRKDGIIGAGNRCCSPEAETRARQVAKILKIPFYVLRLEKEFKKRIVDYFLKEHKAGRTPNPCVICNKEIKFGLLLEKALKLEADFVATGHYARSSLLTNSTIAENTSKAKLLRAKDKNKDQSYFLWMLNQEQLKRILFPIGDYTRKEVENLARKFKLPVLKARKSVEICFIQTTINDFLARHLKQKSGQIIYSTPEVEYRVIGRHQGLAFYTIGQRKGIELPGGPYWVLDKDLKKNILIVTKNEKDLYKKELICKNVNWICGKIPILPLKIKAKIRYRHQLTPATIIRLRSKVYSLKFKVAQRAITPGQSVVFYLPRSSPKAMVRGRGNEVLGGGVIS